MTPEQWKLIGVGVVIGLLFCAGIGLGALWMFRIVMKLEACGFNILTWRNAELRIEQSKAKRPELSND